MQPVRRSSTRLLELVRALLQTTTASMSLSADQHGLDVAIQLVAAIVSYFLGPGAGGHGAFSGALEPHKFQVSPEALGRPGLMRRFGGKSRITESAPVKAAIKKVWLYSPSHGGQLATLLLPKSFGLLVHVKKRVEEIDLSRISGSIDSDPFFSRDGPGSHPRCGGSTWGAVKVHNFVRPMGAPFKYKSDIAS